MLAKIKSCTNLIGCSSNGLTNCPFTCVDYPLICTKCSSGYTTTPDKLQCGMNCSVCPNGDNNCNTGFNDDTSSLCLGPKAACWVSNN